MYKTKFLPGILIASLLALFILSCNNSPDSDNVNDEAEVAVQRYDKTATMLSLAWVSYINNSMSASKDSLQRHATHGVNAILTSPRVIPEIGTWKPVWGPVTYSHDPTCTSCRTDNTMMLLKGKDPKDLTKTMYVVAIAGTNFSSLFDWGNEDFDVLTMAKWPQVPSGNNNNLSSFSTPSTSTDPATTNSGIYISRGINTGLDILFNKMTSEGKTLAEYLKQEFDTLSNPIELAVTGHSLGGGLSPCVALALKDNQKYWNSTQKVTVTTYPFAGQTPGNKRFAAYFGSQIRGKDFNGYFNHYDVVPHGLNEKDMNHIEHLYDDISPQLAKQCLVGKIIHCVKQNVDAFNYTPIYATNNEFTYQVTYSDTAYNQALEAYKHTRRGTCGFITYLDCYSAFDPSYSCQNVFARTENFGSMASIQHLQGYTDYFKIQNVVEVIQSHQIESPPPSFIELYCKTPLFHGCPGTDILCD